MSPHTQDRDNSTMGLPGPGPAGFLDCPHQDPSLPGFLCQCSRATSLTADDGAAQPPLLAPALPSHLLLRATETLSPSPCAGSRIPAAPGAGDPLAVVPFPRGPGAPGRDALVSEHWSCSPGCLVGMLWSQLQSQHPRGAGWQPGPGPCPAWVRLRDPAVPGAVTAASNAPASARGRGGRDWLRRKCFVFSQPRASGPWRCGRGCRSPLAPQPAAIPARSPRSPLSSLPPSSSPAGSPRVFRSHRGRPERARAAAAAAAAGPGAGAARPWRGAAGGGGGGRRGSRICRR